jgi:hypothetical protein
LTPCALRGQTENMREITTHIVEGGPETCRVFVEEELGPGGAPHHYEVTKGDPNTGETRRLFGEIDFQKGGVVEAGLNGLTHEALLAIVIDRLEHFQRGPFPSDDNDAALHGCRGALKRLQKRTRERIARNVEGVSTA